MSNPTEANMIKAINVGGADALGLALLYDEIDRLTNELAEAKVVLRAYYDGKTKLLAKLEAVWKEKEEQLKYRDEALDSLQKQKDALESENSALQDELAVSVSFKDGEIKALREEVERHKNNDRLQMERAIRAEADLAASQKEIVDLTEQLENASKPDNEAIKILNRELFASQKEVEKYRELYEDKFKVMHGTLIGKLATSEASRGRLVEALEKIACCVGEAHRFRADRAVELALEALSSNRPSSIYEAMKELIDASKAVIAEAMKPLKEHDFKVMMAADKRLAEALTSLTAVLGMIEGEKS